MILAMATEHVWLQLLDVSTHALLLLGLKKGDGHFPVENDSVTMAWRFVVVKGDFRIGVESVQEVAGDGIESKFYKMLLGEVGVCWIIKLIQVGHKICKLG